MGRFVKKVVVNVIYIILVAGDIYIYSNIVIVESSIQS